MHPQKGADAAPDAHDCSHDDVDDDEEEDEGERMTRKARESASRGVDASSSSETERREGEWQLITHPSPDPRMASHQQQQRT